MPAELSWVRGRAALAVRRLSPTRLKAGDGASPRPNAARTPPVTRPRRHQEETPAPHAVQPKPNDESRRSRLTNLPRRVTARTSAGVASVRPAFARPTAQTDTHNPLARTERIHSRRAAGPLAQTDNARGQGPLLPEPREEIRNTPRPRCLPSMSYRPEETQLSLGSPSGRALSTGCRQLVDNARRCY